MSLEDPFFVVREEVQKAVQTAKGLYTRWCELLDDPKSVSKEEYDWTTNELRNSLRSIEWDLEDLEETISIVEKNPRKFKIEDSDLRERRSFIDGTRTSVKDMKEHMMSPRTHSKEEIHVRKSLLRPNGPSRPMDKYTRLDNEMERGNSRFINETQQQQQQIIKTQDDQLDMIGGSVGILKNMSHQIGNELEEQNVMLDDFHHTMENTEGRLDTVTKKITKVLHMSNDRRQWCAIGVLLVALLIIVVLFVVLK